VPNLAIFVSNLPSGIDDVQINSIFGAYGTITEVTSIYGTNCCVITLATLEESKWMVDNLNGNMPEGITQPIAVKYVDPSLDYGKVLGAPSVERSSPYGGKGAAPQLGAAQLGASTFGGASSFEVILTNQPDWLADPGSNTIFSIKKSLMQTGCLPGIGKKDDMNQLYIRGLPSDTTDMDLHEIFAPFGAIPCRGVKAMQAPDGSCTGIGFVDFVDLRCAQVALEKLNGTTLADGTVLRISVKNSTRKGGKTGKGSSALPGGIGMGCLGAAALGNPLGNPLGMMQGKGQGKAGGMIAQLALGR